MLPATVLLVGVRSGSGPVAGLAWALLTLVFVVGLPWLVLRVQMYGGRVADRQVVQRRQRHRVMWPGVVSVAVGIIVLWAVGAPRPLLELVLVVLVGALAASVVTLGWKVSVHTAVLAAAGVVAAAHVPLVGYAVPPLLLLLGWARWRAGRHTVAQVVGGAMLGAAAAGVVLALG